jgi:hypothetical protein
MESMTKQNITALVYDVMQAIKEGWVFSKSKNVTLENPEKNKSIGFQLATPTHYKLLLAMLDEGWVLKKF